MGRVAERKTKPKNLLRSFKSCNWAKSLKTDTELGMCVLWSTLNWEIQHLPLLIPLPPATLYDKASAEHCLTEWYHHFLHTVFTHTVVLQNTIFLSSYFAKGGKSKKYGSKRQKWCWWGIEKKHAFQMRGLTFQQSNSICIKRFTLSLWARGCRCSMLNANENWRAGGHAREPQCFLFRI